MSRSTEPDLTVHDAITDRIGRPGIGLVTRQSADPVLLSLWTVGGINWTALAAFTAAAVSIISAA